MKILVLEINNLHIQIVFWEKFKIIVLATFVQIIYNIHDMWFGWVNKYTAHTEANDFLD